MYAHLIRRRASTVEHIAAIVPTGDGHYSRHPLCSQEKTQTPRWSIVASVEDSGVVQRPEVVIDFRPSEYPRRPWRPKPLPLCSRCEQFLTLAHYLARGRTL